MIASCFLWFFLYSLLGWIYETTLCSISQRKFVNRGFLNGPYCPIYGAGALLVILLFGKMTNPFELFICSAVVTCALEYLTSYGMEKLFHAKWWDYSSRRFNLHGRICLEGAFVFGLLSVLVVQFLHPFVREMTALIPAPIRYGLAGTIAAAMLCDLWVTVRAMADFQKKLDAAAQKIAEKKTIALEKLQESERIQSLHTHYEDLASKISRQQHRILLAFPKYRPHRHGELLSELRNTLNTKRKKGGV